MKNKEIAPNKKSIIRAGNWGIGLGVIKIIGALYLFSLPSIVGEELFDALIPIVKIEVFFTLIIGAVYLALGLKIKNDLANSRKSILIILVIGGISAFFSLATQSFLKFGIDIFILFLFYHALKAQKALISE